MYYFQHNYCLRPPVPTKPILLTCFSLCKLNRYILLIYFHLHKFFMGGLHIIISYTIGHLGQILWGCTAWWRIPTMLNNTVHLPIVFSLYPHFLAYNYQFPDAKLMMCIRDVPLSKHRLLNAASLTSACTE